MATGAGGVADGGAGEVAGEGSRIFNTKGHKERRYGMYRNTKIFCVVEGEAARGSGEGARRGGRSVRILRE